MAEHAHVTLVRRGYDAFSRGDMETMSGLLAGDVTHHVPGHHSMSGDYKGLDAVLEYYRQIAAETDGSFRVELERLLVDGRGHVVSVHKASGDRGGRHLDARGGIIFRIVDEKITDLDECEEDLEAGDAFWA